MLLQPSDIALSSLILGASIGLWLYFLLCYMHTEPLKMRVFRWTLILTAAVSLGISAYAAVAPPLAAPQQVVDERTRMNSQRINDLEKKTDTFHIQVESRLTRLETLAETNSKLLTGIFLAVGLMVVETAIRLFGTMAAKVTKQEGGG